MSFEQLWMFLFIGYGAKEGILPGKKSYRFNSYFMYWKILNTSLVTLNKVKMSIWFSFAFFLVTLCHAAIGPVYVDPNAPQEATVVKPTAVQPQAANLITQTVYGFLDFTTTIGNTVMVFSPQSAAVPTGECNVSLS